VLLTSDILPCASRSERAGPGSPVLLIGIMLPCASRGCGLVPCSSGALLGASPTSLASLRIRSEATAFASVELPIWRTMAMGYRPPCSRRAVAGPVTLSTSMPEICDTIAQHFHAADAIYAASGEPLESAFADWVQPARC